ncbi:MAG: DUF4974 domain-containing protein [Bacteroidales bacterium]|nr:DUF4974 domain-containing protein [Bacteroidales bacterium]MCF8389573.1 DUF4974 domain-containing protein [Bacteroidales bacterium]
MKIDYQIIKRYLDTEGSQKDKSLIISWFNSIHLEKELREASNKYWDEIPENTVPQNYNESKVLGNIYRKIKIKEGRIISISSKSARIFNFLTKVAAILFIPLLVHNFIVNFSHNASTNEIAYREIYSPFGARTMFYLPDGSHGWLNGGSSLKFPERFEGNSRKVSMNGEAYFDVVSNPKKPFIVSGKHLEIIAKGTSFNVSAWDDAPETEVVLVEGKLEIYCEKKDEKKRIAILNPGQLLHYLPDQTGSYIINTDADKYVSWTEGKLVFKEDPFTDVVKRINRWYNVNIVIKDEILKTYKYVATFEDETLDEILKMLKISAPMSYREIKRVQSEDGTFGKRNIEVYYKPFN